MKKLSIILISMTLSSMIHADTFPVLFGTSQSKNNGSKGIYATSFNSSNGKLSGKPYLVAEVISPGFLVMHDTLPILYSIGTSLSENEPGIFSYQINTKNKSLLKPINSQPTNAGRSAHLDVDPKGRMLVCVQYGDATVSVFPLSQDGSLMPTSQTIQHTHFTNVNPKRQEKAHPHNVTFDPSGKYACVPDLGADMVYVYKADYDSTRLVLHDKVKIDPGSGPRHLKFSKDGKFVYVLNELSLTVDAFRWNAKTGKMSHLATVEGLPDNLREPGSSHTASEIRIHPNGKFIYTANRGHNSISVFSLNPKTKIPKLLEVVSAEVDWPRNFSLDPSGKWLICAGQLSNDVSVFAVDPDSGRIEFQPGSRKSVPGPICVLPVNR